MERKFTVHARWDEEAGVWYVESSDVIGLATEAATIELLQEKLAIMIPELLEANGQIGDGDSPAIPFHLLADYDGKVANPRFT